MEQEDTSSFWFVCPSGIKSHRFEKPQEYLVHIQTCSQLSPSMKGQDIVEPLEYAVCPQNSLHLKKMQDPLTGKRWSLSQIQKIFFKRCRHPTSMDLQNKQDTICLGAGRLNAYLTLVNSALEENQSEETSQEDIVQYDFEQERKHFLNEQQFAQTMGSSRNIRFIKSNNSIVNMALVKTSKDLRLNFRNFGNSCQILDEVEEGFSLNVSGDRREFLNRLMEGRPGMYLTITQKNSIFIQMEFERPKEYYFVSVGEKEIGLLMKQQLEASKTFKLIFLSKEEYSRKATKLINVSPQSDQLSEQCLLPPYIPPSLPSISDYHKTKNQIASNIMQKEIKKPSILLYSGSTTNSSTATSSKVTITIDNDVEIIDQASPISILLNSENFSEKKILSPFSISSPDESTITNDDKEWLEHEYTQQQQPEEDKTIQLDDDEHNFVIFRKMRNLIDSKNKLPCLETSILHRSISKLKKSKIKTFTIRSSTSCNHGKIIPKIEFTNNQVQ